ncbi:hypothetical protein [Oceanobacter mangrovi]|uniref:hypothetical protein n=1 Tax=Oceanobacter mangrovi TaxID=2862510 RepID=UPI001C8DEC80|nr:hypothetical protein [Oceanobacter mangrovi]
MRIQFLIFTLAGVLATFAEAFGIDWWSVTIVQVAVIVGTIFVMAVLLDALWARRDRQITHQRHNRFSRDLFLSAYNIAISMAGVVFGCTLASSTVGWLEGSFVAQVFAVVGWVGLAALTVTAVLFKKEIGRIRA